jgi:Holliday junction resolvasome RuvABC endonuclease subunit
VTTDLGQQALLDPEPTRTIKADPDYRNWWGVDTSTVRVSLASIAEDGTRKVNVRSFTRSSEHGKRLALIWEETREFAVSWAMHFGWPGFVFVEQPFAGKHGVPPISYMAQGVITAAIYDAVKCVVEPVPPPRWKSVALGNGGANKEKVAEWARLNGCPSDLQDDCDAWAIAEAARRTVRFV